MVVSLGLALRLRELLNNRSLWRDEASLVFNLQNRGLFGFTEPLDHDQGTPPGFFVLAQSAGRWLGGSEIAYRSIPFLASCTALVVVALLARRRLGPIAGLVAVGALATSATLVYYGAEVKQYSVDMAITALLWLLADEGSRRQWTPAVCGIFAFGGGVAILSSYPAVFVLPILGLVAVADAWPSRDAVGRLIGVGATWLLVLATSYFAWTADLNESEFLQRFWAAGFLPIPPTSISDLEQWGAALRTLFTQLVHPDAVIFVALCAALGTTTLVQRSRMLVTVLLGPLVLAIIASTLELYPAIERSLLFILPAIAIFVGVGIDEAGRLLARHGRQYIWFPALAISAIATAPALGRASHPPGQEELRPLLEVLDGREHDATVLVTDTSEVAWHYYADRLDLRPREVIVREFPRQDRSAARAVLGALAGIEELWVVDVAFWRPIAVLDPQLVDELDAAGARIDEYHGTGASVYIYDLSARPRT